MRASERRLVEALARALAGPACPLVVAWAASIPGATPRARGSHAWAVQGPPWLLVLAEDSWAAASTSDRLDTLHHEIAHVHAWAAHGFEIQDHGREWRKAYAALGGRRKRCTG